MTIPPGRKTNIRSELWAILTAIKATAHMPDIPLVIKTDSKYSIDSIEKWFNKWTLNNFKLKGGKTISNLDVLQSIIINKSNRDIKFRWIKGHSGYHFNELADQLAGRAMKIDYEMQFIL